MKKRLLPVLGFALILTACSQKGPNDYVNPFIGTDFNGHTFPGATVPHGLVQAGPQTGILTWDYCSGYRFTDSLVLGFSQTRLSGTGCADLGDVLVMPFSDSVRASYASHFEKARETAVPGYYSAYLDENRVMTEITADAHTALYRFSFAGPQRNVFINLNSVTGGRKVLSAEIACPDEYTLEGMVRVKGWNRRQYAFVMQFDAPVAASRKWSEENMEAPLMVFSFPESRRPLMMKIALSTVSSEGARMNMDAEIPAWDFSAVRKKASAAWTDVLSLVTPQGSDSDKTVFYTALYHMYIQPNNIADVDGLSFPDLG